MTKTVDVWKGGSAARSEVGGSRVDGSTDIAIAIPEFINFKMAPESGLTDRRRR